MSEENIFLAMKPPPIQENIFLKAAMPVGEASSGTPSCGWGFEYVKKGDEVIVEWDGDMRFTNESTRRFQGKVVDIDDWIYLRGRDNTSLRCPVKSVRLHTHLVVDNGQATQSIDPPTHRLSNPFA